MLSPHVASRTQVPPNLNLPGDRLIPAPASPSFPHRPFHLHLGEFTSPVSTLPPTVPCSVTPTFLHLLGTCFHPICFDRIWMSSPHWILAEFASPVFTSPPHSFIWLAPIYASSISTTSGLMEAWDSRLLSSELLGKKPIDEYTESDISVLKQAVAYHFTQSFFDHFGCVAIVPHCFWVFIVFVNSY